MSACLAAATSGSQSATVLLFSPYTTWRSARSCTTRGAGADTALPLLSPLSCLRIAAYPRVSCTLMEPRQAGRQTPSTSVKRARQR